ncbi:hypothetical protein LEN26_014252 [Aphanomyces euteiches]|nr:hypothetical protein LEN26_014252 [Aphanomyces euteiches]
MSGTQAFETIFKDKPTTRDGIMTAFNSLLQEIQPTELQVELMWAQWDLILQCLVPQLYNCDAWVLYYTKHTVNWLPTQHMRLLSNDSLLRLLLSPLGDKLLGWIQSQKWEDDSVETLVNFKSQSPGTFAMALQIISEADKLLLRYQHVQYPLLSSKLKILTLNVNGIQQAAHTIVETYLQYYHILFLQETKFSNQHHIDDFYFHLDRVIGRNNYKCFINDQRTVLPDGSLAYPSGGILTYFHKDTPGFANLTPQDRSIQNRYMTIRTQWQGTEVFFHNIYAPVQHADKATFFHQLPTNFAHDSIHFAFGDFNIPIHEHLDATQFNDHHEQGKTAMMEWLLELSMEAIWRLNNPDTLTYSSPSRQTVLTMALWTHQSSMSHDPLTVILEPKDTKHGRPQWKFPRELASDSQYKTFIEEATGELLQHWSNTPQLNLGISWLKWKKWIRRETKDYYKQFKHSRLQTLHEANILMRTNKAQYLLGEITQQQYNISKDVHKEIRAQYHEFNMDQRFEFHATQMEAPTKFFFRKPRDTVAARTISEVKDTEGTMQTKQSEIEKTFVEHWTRIMNTEIPRRSTNTRPKQKCGVTLKANLATMKPSG